tara:strand:- start:532 stop:1269 length:738 start_codon:yes stop_codon:yes gene_type:complete
MSKTLILIPSRLTAKRLPRKPLLKINNLSIISHVFKKALESKIGEVYVCTGDKEIYEDVKINGGNCILTTQNHQTGTDRIYEGLKNINLNVDYILNIQGDEPMIDIQDIKNLSSIAQKNQSEIATLACKLNDKKKINNENVVKVETFDELEKKRISKAIKFTRNIQVLDSQKIYQHIGIYHYKVSILKKFIELPQTNNEIKFKLEQLRALENNINIDVILANSAPIGVDTENDYIEIKKLMEYKS